MALFALDKHDCVPVDTHVWQLALQYYTPHLQGKTLTPRIMVAVEEAIVGVFGPFAGWAHNALFIAELASFRCGGGKRKRVGAERGAGERGQRKERVS